MADADVRWLQRLDNYGRSLATLQRAITIANARPLSELEEQGLIQAFEVTHELSWLLLKDFLVDQGVSGISGSRDAVREAVVRELLTPGSEATWMAMILSRHLTSHTYIPGLAHEIAQVIQRNPAVERILLYGSRAMGRHRSGSDIDLCLEAPTMDLGELLILAAELDDLLLPWRIDLQLRHLIDHEGLQAHISRVGRVVLDRSKELNANPRSR